MAVGVTLERSSPLNFAAPPSHPPGAVAKIRQYDLLLKIRGVKLFAFADTAAGMDRIQVGRGGTILKPNASFQMLENI